MPLLEIEHLSFAVPSGRFRSGAKKQILTDVSLSIEEGSAVGLIGESGCGKTTLAHCIAGLLRPVSGTIRFAGSNIFPGESNRRRAGTAIQLLFQNHTASLDPRMRIRDSLLEGIRPKRGRDDQDGILGKLLELVNLHTAILPRYPHQLSGGQRQRVALARALSVSPKLLILDEPGSALDALTERQLLETIRQIQKEMGLSILYISHDLRTAFQLCEFAAVMEKGRIVEMSSTAEMRRRSQHPYTQRVIAETFH
jgi:ABC-type glutathione transport system ATPase component